MEMYEKIPKTKKLYELPRGEGIVIHVGDVEVIFDHIDGMYSYCWRKDDRNHLVHLMVGSELAEREDGSYDLVSALRLPPDNVL